MIRNYIWHINKAPKMAIAQRATKDAQSFTKKNLLKNNTSELLMASSIVKAERNNSLNSSIPNFVVLSDFFEQLCDTTKKSTSIKIYAL